MRECLMTQRRPEIRYSEDGKTKTISGYAAVFANEKDAGTRYKLWDDMEERIQPGAFDRALKDKHDVRALFNHEPNNLLGRSTSGTLRLSTDSVGLKYEIDLPDTQQARDVATLIDRGDLDGSSFGFVARKVEWEDRGGMSYRKILDVDLIDVGPVTYPAYTSTTAQMRSEVRSRLEQERKEQAPPDDSTDDAEAIFVALAISEIDTPIASA